MAMLSHREKLYCTPVFDLKSTGVWEKIQMQRKKRTDLGKRCK